LYLHAIVTQNRNLCLSAPDLQDLLVLGADLAAILLHPLLWLPPVFLADLAHALL